MNIKYLQISKKKKILSFFSFFFEFDQRMSLKVPHAQKQRNTQQKKKCENINFILIFSFIAIMYESEERTTSTNGNRFYDRIAIYYTLQFFIFCFFFLFHIEYDQFDCLKRNEKGKKRKTEFFYFFLRKLQQID